MRSLSVLVAVLGSSLVACGTPVLFPPSATKDVTPTEFGVLQASPDVFKGRVVQVAGRIVEVQPVGKGWLIVAQELPLVEHPVYGPAETVGGTPRFAVEYPGSVDPSGLWYGNKVVVLAVAQGTQPVLVDGAVHKEPYMVARCMHIWKTGPSYGLADFPHTADGYWPLEHETYCAQ